MVKTTTTAAPAPNGAAAPKGIRKLDLGGIATKKETGKTEYPKLPDDSTGTVANLVVSIREKAAKLEALEGSLEIDKSELVILGKQFFFAHCHGKADIPSSISAQDDDGHEVLISFQNRYKAVTDEAALAAVCPDSDTQFRQKFTLKIDGDLIPEDKAGDILAELQELFGKHGCGEALTALSSIQPVKAFHTTRHTAYSPEVNLAIDRVAPMVAAIKTKGRRK